MKKKKFVISRRDINILKDLNADARPVIIDGVIIDNDNPKAAEPAAGMDPVYIVGNFFKFLGFLILMLMLTFFGIFCVFYWRA